MQKEATATNQADKLLEFKGVVLEVLKQVLCGILSFFMASCSLSFAVSPFGLSFVAGVPVKYVLFSGLGSFFGYFFPFERNTFGYIASTLAVVAVRLIITRQTKAFKEPIWAAIFAGVSQIVVGIIANSHAFLPDGIIAISGGIMAAIGAYCISLSSSANFKEIGLNNHTLSVMAVAVNIILTGVFGIYIGPISVGHVLAMATILAVSRFAKQGGGTVFGVSAAAVALLCQNSHYVAFFFAISGLICGLVSLYGKIVQSLAFVATASLFIIYTGAEITTVTLTIEAAVGAVIFCVLPKDILNNLGKAVTPRANIANLDGLRKALIMRLKFSSDALKSVFETTKEVANALSLNTRPDFATVMQRVENEACKGCSFRAHCWETAKKETADAILAMADSIKKSEPISLAAVPENFAERCLRRERFENVLYKHYTEYLSLISADNRIKEMREVVSEQFLGISYMLTELSNEFENYQQYDTAAADLVANALQGMGLRVTDCGAVLDKENRMNIEVRLEKIPDFPISRSKVLYLVNEICEREFEPPQIKKMGKECFITLSEKATYCVDTAVTQTTCNSGKYCGDTSKVFYDGKGHIVMLLCDGMGTGGLAAVDSAMTSALTEKLIASGLGFDCALKIVNSAMLYKSSDESFSTVDITTIDLFSGKASLFKAGAAPTIVRRNGRTGKAECRSLPIGILRDVGFDKASITLREGDIVLMMSDGACSDGTDWICEIVEGFCDGRAKALCDQIAASAARRRSDGHQDDITVMAAIIENAI